MLDVRPKVIEAVFDIILRATSMVYIHVSQIWCGILQANLPIWVSIGLDKMHIYFSEGDDIPLRRQSQ